MRVYGPSAGTGACGLGTPDYRIDRGEVRHYPTIPLVNGYVAMPATFTPGPRVLSGYAESLPIRLEPVTAGG